MVDDQMVRMSSMVSIGGCGNQWLFKTSQVKNSSPNVQHEIKKAFEELDKGKPDPNQYPGGYAYMFLHLAYKLDYLVKPEGFMMDALEKIHRAYFASSPEEKSTQLKNIAFRKEFQKLPQKPQEPQKETEQNRHFHIEM